MARTPSYAYEDFQAAARDIEASGARVTFAAVRGRIGGSYEVVRRYLDRWDKERGQREVVRTVPQHLVGGMQAWFDQARAEAMAIARAELASEAETLMQERQALDEARLAMTARTATAEALAIERERRVVEVLEARDVLSRALALAQASEAQAVQRAEALTQQLQALHLEHARALSQASVDLQDQHAQHLLDAQKSREAAADAMRQALLMRDELRTAQQKWAQDLEASLSREASTVRQSLTELTRQQALSAETLSTDHARGAQDSAEGLERITSQLCSLQEQVATVAGLQHALRERLQQAEEGTHVPAE